jgi:hypothetical protein
MKISTELKIVGAESLEKAVAAELAEANEDGDIQALLDELDKGGVDERPTTENNS